MFGITTIKASKALDQHSQVQHAMAAASLCNQ